MKTVLCFGDSNTFGYIPSGIGRFSVIERYTGILSTLLGPEYNVVANGVVGRTTVYEDPVREGKRGISDVEESVRSANPDIFVIALGTNDVKQAFNNSEADITAGIDKIINLVLSVKPDVQVVIMVPAPISEDALPHSNDYNSYSLEVSANLHTEVEKYAKEHGYKFLNIGSFTNVSPVDGEHLATESHKMVAERLCEIIKSM